MKKYISKITALVAAAGIAATAGINAAAEGNSLVVLGDSITSGYGLEGYTSGDNYSAPKSFANQLGAAYSDYQNFAVDGRTSGELLTALEDENISAALSGADTVVVSIGGNDFLQPMINSVMSLFTENSELLEEFQNGEITDPEEYLDIMREFTDAMTEAANSVDTTATGENLRGILGRISELSPDCQTILLTVYNPFEGVEGMELLDVTAREKLAELNAEITAAAEEYGAQTADIFTAFKGNAEGYTNISSMDIHPNKDGHALIYSILSEMTGTTEIPAEETMQPAAPSKGSPDTGAESIAVFIGAAALAAAGIFASKHK